MTVVSFDSRFANSLTASTKCAGTATPDTAAWTAAQTAPSDGGPSGSRYAGAARTSAQNFAKPRGATPAACRLSTRHALTPRPAARHASQARRRARVGVGLRGRRPAVRGVLGVERRLALRARRDRRRPRGPRPRRFRRRRLLNNRPPPPRLERRLGRRRDRLRRVELREERLRHRGAVLRRLDL